MSHTRSHISANIFAVFFKLVRLLLRAALSVSVSVAQAAQSAGAWASARASLCARHSLRRGPVRAAPAQQAEARQAAPVICLLNRGEIPRRLGARVRRRRTCHSYIAWQVPDCVGNDLIAACEQGAATQVAASKSPEPRVVGSRTVSQTQS